MSRANYNNKLRLWNFLLYLFIQVATVAIEMLKTHLPPAIEYEHYY